MYIAPEEMVGDRRSGMQRTVKTQATEYVPQRRNENRIKKDWGMDQQRSRMQGRSTFQVRSVACRECMKKGLSNEYGRSCMDLFRWCTYLYDEGRSEYRT